MHALLKSNFCTAARILSPVGKIQPLFSGNAAQFSSKMIEESEVDDVNSDDSSTQQLTVEDVNILTVLLKEIIELKNIGGRSGLGDVSKNAHRYLNR